MVWVSRGKGVTVSTYAPWLQCREDCILRL